MVKAMNWESVIEVAPGDLDYLGHVTAARYLAYFEEARVEWLRAAFAEREPAYVVVSQRLDYLREVLLRDGPLRAQISLIRVGTASFELDERLLGAASDVRCRSTATLVAFDPDARRARPLSDEERRHLARQSPCRHRGMISRAARPREGHRDRGMNA
jgi:acyl-CoA thioesterase FadM